MTCERSALVLSALGVVAIGIMIALDGVTIANRQLRFRSLTWRWFWRVAWASFLGGIALSALVCGSPAGS